jgi:hypothetical protein
VDELSRARGCRERSCPVRLAVANARTSSSVRRRHHAHFGPAGFGLQCVVRQCDHKHGAGADLGENSGPPFFSAAERLIQPDAFPGSLQMLNQCPDCRVVPAGVTYEHRHLHHDLSTGCWSCAGSLS